MANNIALTLTIDGVQQTITTISQLETAIKAAKEQLAGLEIGSVEFKNLSTQIRQADSALQNLNESIAGKKLAENIERYAKIGSAITGSFAAAQAAISLFGNESEEITRAAAQAQNLLTIALVGRQVAEGAVAASTLIADLATKAQTASTLAADSATKRFYATLAANPYTALLVGVGLLVTALLSFGKATDEAAKKEKEFKEALNKDIAKEVTQMQLLVNQVNNTSLSLNTRKKALDDLQKQFPAYFENLNKEDILTGKVKIATDTLTDAIIKQAQARALQGRIEERAVKLLDLEEKILKATKDRQAAEEQARQGGRGITGGGSVAGVGGAQVAETGATNRLARATSELNKLRQEKTEIDRQNIADTQKINSLTIQTDKVIGTQTETVEKNNKELKVNNELINKIIQSYKNFNIAVFELGDSSTEIETSLQKQVDELESLISKLSEASTIEGKLIQLQTTLAQKNDNVGDAFDRVRQKSEDFFNQLKDGNATQEEVRKSGELLRKEALKIADDLGIPEESRQQLERYVLLYTQFTDAVAKFQTTDGKPPFDAATFEKDLIDVLLLTNKIKIDPFGDTRTPEVLQKELLDAQERLQKDQEAFIKSYVESRRKEARAQIAKLNVDELKEFEKGLAEAGKLAFENLVEAGNQVIIFENGIETVRKSVDDLNKELAKLGPQAQRALIVENIDLISDQYNGILYGIAKSEEDLSNLRSKLKRRDFSEEERYGELLTGLQEGLAARNIDISTLSYEEKLKLLESFLNKEIEATQNAEQKKQDAQQKTLDNISKFIQEFQGVLNQLGQITSEYFSFQLDKVDKRYEDSLSKIVGDTEEANEKRIEAEEIYQRQRKEIEKKAARTSLGISLVQAIANTAEAVTKALAAGPISGQILAGITAALGAVQVGLITAQISQLNNYRRGGIIKGQGGMVVGPSHEYGGVRFAAGGGVELEGGEAVINRMGSLRYSSLLNSINTSTGGKPINVSNFDDSRIVEAIAKQRSEPIRAFVVESDITNRQNISKRLDQLARI
jgi:hypothetical protein